MLTINQLTKHYKGSSKGVTGLDLEIKAGDIYAFIGHNGAGDGGVTRDGQSGETGYQFGHHQYYSNYV